MGTPLLDGGRVRAAGGRVIDGGSPIVPCTTISSAPALIAAASSAIVVTVADVVVMSRVLRLWLRAAPACQGDVCWSRDFACRPVGVGFSIE